MDAITFEFECGCFEKVWVHDGRLQGGLGCCKEHDRHHVELKDIVPLKLVRVIVTDDPKADQPPVT